MSNISSSDLDSTNSSKICLACKKFTENYDTSASKTALNRLLEGQLHKIENLYKCALDKIENLRLKYKLASEELEHYRKVSEKLAEENENLHCSLANFDCQDNKEKQNFEKWKQECIITLDKLKKIELKLANQNKVDNHIAEIVNETFNAAVDNLNLSKNKSKQDNFITSNDELIKENEQLADDLKRTKESNTEMQKQIISFENKFDLLRKIICDNCEQISFENNNEFNVQFLQNEINFIIKSNQQLEDELEKCEKQKPEFLRQIVDLKNQVEILKNKKIQKIVNDPQEFNDLQEENYQLHKEIRKMNELVDEQTRECDKKLNVAIEELRKLNIENKNLKINNHPSDGDVEALKKANNEITENIKSLNTKLEKLSQEKNQLFDENKHLKDEINHFYKRLFNSGQKYETEIIIRNLREYVNQLKFEKEYQIQKNKDYKNEIIKLYAKLEQLKLNNDIKINRIQIDITKSPNNNDFKIKLNEMEKNVKILEESFNLLQQENQNYIEANNLLKEKNNLLEKFYNRISKRKRIIKRENTENKKTEEVKNDEQVERLNKTIKDLMTDNNILVERVETLTTKLEECPKTETNEMKEDEITQIYCKCTNRCTAESCFKKFMDRELEKKQNIIKKLEDSIEVSNKLLKDCEIEMKKLRSEKDDKLTDKDVGFKMEIALLNDKITTLEDMLETERRAKIIETVEDSNNLTSLLRPLIKELEEKLQNEPITSWSEPIHSEMKNDIKQERKGNKRKRNLSDAFGKFQYPDTL